MKDVLREAIMTSGLGVFSAIGLVFLFAGLLLIIFRTMSKNKSKQYEKNARIILD